MLAVAAVKLGGPVIRLLKPSPVTVLHSRPRPRDHLELHLELLGIPGNPCVEDELAHVTRLLLLPLLTFLGGRDLADLVLLTLLATLLLDLVPLRPP